MTSMESYSLPKSTIEFEPPTASIRRLLKTALPNSTHVSKDSCAAITRACGIFVLYVTSCANDLAREGRRTTISAKDVLGALQELDWEEFLPQMEKFLEQYRTVETMKKEEKERVKAAAAVVKSPDNDLEGVGTKERDEEEENEEDETPQKKQKVDHESSR